MVIVDDLPTERHHGWKFIDFGPDGKLYVPVGAPCNVCERPDPFATVLRMNADGIGTRGLCTGHSKLSWLCLASDDWGIVDYG